MSTTDTCNMNQTVLNVDKLSSGAVYAGEVESTFNEIFFFSIPFAFRSDQELFPLMNKTTDIVTFSCFSRNVGWGDIGDLLQSGSLFYLYLMGSVTIFHEKLELLKRGEKMESRFQLSHQTMGINFNVTLVIGIGAL